MNPYVDVARPLQMQLGGSEEGVAPQRPRQVRRLVVCTDPRGSAIRETLHIFSSERRNIVAQVRRQAVETSVFPAINTGRTVCAAMRYFIDDCR